jgi:hypothetical protein
MYEMITLKCQCGDVRVSAAPEVDIAELLLCAIGAGWTQIDEHPTRVAEADGLTEIELAGQCENCTGKVKEQLRTVESKIAFAARRGLVR